MYVILLPGAPEVRVQGRRGVSN